MKVHQYFRPRVLLVVTVIFFEGLLMDLIEAQKSPQASSLVSQHILEIVPKCYTNATAFDRRRRQPMHMDNLITIIRKIEDKTDYLWDVRRISRYLVRRYQFDGITYDPTRPSVPYSQAAREAHKTGIIHKLIPDNKDEWPQGILDNDEECALHWMLSHSTNATYRDEDDLYPDNFMPKYGLREKREPQYRQYYPELDRDGNRPVELGVVYTRWGSINAGRVIAGIAAGLEPQSRDVEVEKTYRTMGGGEPGYPPPLNPGNPNAGSPNGGGYRPQPPLNNGGGMSGYGAGYGVQNPTGIGNLPTVNARPGSQSSKPYHDVTYPNYGGVNYNPSPPGPPGTIPSYDRNSPQNPNPFANIDFNQSDRRTKRQAYNLPNFQKLTNLHAATLAGDIGQAAILNSPNEQSRSYPPPSGYWNDTTCPREFILKPMNNPKQDPHYHGPWSYMTGAEIRGGIDGAVLGSIIREWDQLAPIKLSEILQMYYSETGVSFDPTFRSCDRAGLFVGRIPDVTLREQSRSFAYLFNQKAKEVPITDINVNDFYQWVEEALAKMRSFASSLSSVDPPCKRRTAGGVDPDDRDKLIKPQVTVYVVLDHGVTREEYHQQLQFVGKMTHDLRVSPKGSRVGLVDGRSGNIIISPNFTDNAAVLACRIMDQPILAQTGQDIVGALRSIRSDIQRYREQEERLDYKNGTSPGITILIIVQAKKIDEGRRDDIREILRDFDRYHGDVRVLYTSSKFQAGDFERFTLHGGDDDFIKIRANYNLTEGNEAFMQEFLKRTHTRLYYPRCDPRHNDQDDEYKLGSDLFIYPGSIQYYKISPDYFFKSIDLRNRFTSDFGRVRVCMSVLERFPSSLNYDKDQDRVYCKETHGTYEAPGGSNKDVEFIITKPCSGRKRDGCRHIYFSITPIYDVKSQGLKPDCSIVGCETPDQVKVTWSHHGMRCKGSSLLFSSSIFIVLSTAILSLFNQF